MKKIILLLFALMSLPAFSYDWSVISTINVVEPTGVPDQVKLQIDSVAGPCKTGTWLIWKGKTSDPKANVEAIYSAALAALVSGNEVKLYGTNDCLLEFMHVTKSQP